MGEVDLLEGLTFGPTVSSDVVKDYFTQNFWGEKNQGFDVLYHNMKHGQTSVKSLQDFIKESANADDLYAKHLTKLAGRAANSSPLGSFAPLFEVFKVMAEKLSSCHMDVVHKLQEIIKELSKYLEEQKSKHKQVKDELGGCADALHQIQNATAQVQRSKEKYHQLCMDTERLKRSGALSKDVDKAEVKSKKAAEEYRNLVDKYTNVRMDYEQKMTESAKRFQEIEVAHLKHMKSVLASYILSYENANVLMSQVHQEFRRQCNENTIESLIKHYSETKGTGTEKPGPIQFEVFDVNSMPIPSEPTPNGVSTDDGSSQTAGRNVSRQFNPFRRIRRNKPPKESTGSSNKDTDKDNESMESPGKEVVPDVDEEGFTIRPESPKGSKSSWGFDSSDDSDSDAEGIRTRKIHVQIKDKPVVDSGNCNLDALNAITRNLTLSSPNPMGGKKPTPASGNLKKQNDSSSGKTEKSMSDELLLDLLGNSTATSTLTPAASSTNDNMNVLSDLFSNKPKSEQAATIGHSSSNVSLNNMFTLSSDNESVKKIETPSHSSVNFVDSTTSTTTSSRPTNLTLPNAWNDAQKGPSTAPLASSESWSSLSSLGGTPMDSFASSRGPSPLPILHGDPIPIAVAFTETVNAYFKGTKGERCIAKVNGEVHVSFPAGIVRAFTSNPNPSVLSFMVKGTSKIQEFTPNSNYLQTDAATSDDASERLFWFDMSSLTSHIKKMADSNPNALYYNIQVLSYQLTSQTGHSIVPLHLTSSWKFDSSSTDITVDYKYNADVTSNPLRNVQVIIPVDGGVTGAQSMPSATWNAAQNRLLWRLTTPISSASPSGTLKSTLSLSAGPSSSSSLAVQFTSEGSTLTGTDFDLTGSGYRLSLVKKKIMSGKYILDGN